MPKDRIISKIMGLTGALLFVAACTSGGGSGSDNNNNNTTGKPPVTPTPTPAPTATPVPTPTPTPTPIGNPGDFVSSADITEADTQQFYTAGCKVPGEAASKKMIDPRIKVGDVARDSILFADPDHEYRMTLESTITSVAAKTSTMTTKVLATTIPGVNVGQTSRTTCEVVSDDEGECRGENSVDIAGIALYVFIPNIIFPAKKDYQVGWYILDDGRAVPAWRVQENAVGWIANPQTMQIVDDGEQTVTNIYAPTLPTFGLEMCGGTQVLTDTFITLTDGTPVNRIGGQVLGFKAK